MYFKLFYRNTNNMKDLSGKMKETKDNATDAETLCIGKTCLKRKLNQFILCTVCFWELLA